ncbi:hypothetical protein L218DRAFT_1008156 [Marasmius fiardii PR-910]|nr:hypothetical protein L218DRAFT_1008156 [Marasmius fiardii PR-910]
MSINAPFASDKRGERSKFTKTVYRDGVIYYVFIFVCSMLNVIVVGNLPRDMTLNLLAFVRVFHSLMASRAVLHIHQVNEPHDNALQTTSDIHFGTQTGIEYGDISTLQPVGRWDPDYWFRLRSRLLYFRVSVYYI